MIYNTYIKGVASLKHAALRRAIFGNTVSLSRCAERIHSVVPEGAYSNRKHFPLRRVTELYYRGPRDRL